MTKQIIATPWVTEFSLNIPVMQSYWGMVAAVIGLVNENKGVLQKLLQLNDYSRVNKTV